MHYVFLLHGIGINSAGWSLPVSKLLSEKAVVYAAASGQKLSPVEFVELRYDHILERNMQQFLSGGTVLGKCNEWLAKGWQQRTSGAKLDLNSFIRDYALDIGCYLFAPDTTIEVLDTLAKRMLEIMVASPLKNDFSLVCHSLGTKVGFDLVHMLYSKAAAGNPKGKNLDKLSPLFGLRPNGDVVATSPDFSGFYLIANVMPLLNRFDNRTHDANTSHVRISIPGTQGGVVRNNYRIVNNHLDPVARSGGTGSIQKNVYTSGVGFSQANAWLMHYLNQYAEHPLVHIPLIEDFYKITIADQVKKKAIAEFDAKFHNTAMEAALETAFKLLPDAAAIPAQQNIVDFLFNYAEKLAAALPASRSPAR